MVKKTKIIKRKVAKPRVSRADKQTDSIFFLKLTVLLILGSQWIHIEHLPSWSIPIPVGLVIGLVFVSHEHFKIDRKIEYLMLLLAAFIGFWLPIGLIFKV